GALAFDNIVVNRLDAPTPLPAEEATPEVGIAQAPPIVRDPLPNGAMAFVVNTPRDFGGLAIPNDGWCTLRDAITAANYQSADELDIPFPECGGASTSIEGKPDEIHFAMNDPL